MAPIEQPTRRRRRTHSPEGKAELIATCQQPGVSLAAIAMDHAINPSLLRRWMIEPERLEQHELVEASPVQRDVAAQFVPLRLPQPEQAPSPVAQDEILIDLQRNDLKATIRWPIAQADRCAAWLREVMR